MTIKELFIQRCDTPHNIDKHLPVLLGYASMVEHVVELGTDIGFSTTAFLASGVKELDCYDLVLTEDARRLCSMARNGPTSMRLHEKNTLDASIPPCDLLFIDTEHTYRQVVMELSLHTPKASRFVILHDIVAFPCIVPAIHDYLDRHPEWGIREWSQMQNGLAILERIEYG